MHDYMDYCLRCYLRETGWNNLNQYSNLRASARAILDFKIPHGLSFHAGRAPSDWLKSAHSFQPLPRMNGSIGYMYTSKRLTADPQSVMGMTEVAEGFQSAFSAIETAPTVDKSSIAQNMRWSGEPDFFLYGRMFFPTGELEAMMARRATQHTQYVLTGLSSSDPRDPIQLTMQWWHDRGPWCTEVSYSTDDSMIGLRGLYNFRWPDLPSKANHLFSTGESSASAFADFSAHDHASSSDSSDSTTHHDASPVNSNMSTSGEEAKIARSRSSAVARTTGVPSRRMNSKTSNTPSAKTRSDTQSIKKTTMITPNTHTNNGSHDEGDGIWSAGAEIYYSAKEKSGGVSTGLRYRATQPFVFEVTNIINPAMGYTSTAYTAAVNPQLTCSTRFDFNLYSYESDLCIGAEWRNGGEGVVKGRFGFRQGLALLFDGRYRNALFSFGIVIDANQRTNAFFRSIGLQIQYIS